MPSSPCSQCGVDRATGYTCNRLVCGLERHATYNVLTEQGIAQRSLTIPPHTNRLRIERETLKIEQL